MKNRKAQALLIYLALTAQPQSRTHLATLLWGDRFEDQARSSLRQALYALRKALGEDVVVGDDLLSIADGALKLEEAGAGNFLAHFRLGEEAFDDWLDQTREMRRQDAALEALETARQQEQTGKPEEALATIRAALRLEPLDEQLVRMEIGLLAGLGRRTEALSRYTQFAGRLGQELDAAPEAETEKLVARIRADNAPSSPDNSLLDGVTSGANILIAPFDDLGGGDTATFLARDLPVQIVHASTRGLMLLDLLPEARPDQAEVSSLERARSAEATWLLSGTVRQIGTRVRIALTSIDAKTGSVAATDTTLINEDDAFEYLETVSDTVTAMWRSRYLKLGGHDQTLIERLKRSRNQPELFQSILQDAFYHVFYSRYSRAALEAMDEAADYAIAEFPTNAEFYPLKAWAHFSRTDLLDATTRLEGIRAAKSIFEHALMLKPDLTAVYLGLASVSYWLGDHEKSEDFLQKCKLSATAIPVVDIVKGNSAMFCGRTDEALETLDRALENGAGLASMANWYATYALAHFNKRNYEKALSSANAAMEFSTEYWLSYLVKMAALARLERAAEARETVDAYDAEYPGAHVQELDWLPFTDNLAKSNFFDALRDAGLPELSSRPD